MKKLLTYLLLLFSFGSQAQIHSVHTQVLTPTDPPDSIVSSVPDNQYCEGESVQLSISGGTLGDGAEWVWYMDTCGVGTAIDTGTTITVNPVGPQALYFCTTTGGCNMPCVGISLSENTASSGCTPLPLHLLSFDAVLYKENKGLITWEVTGEEKNTKYDLYKSVDSKKFNVITSKEAKATNGVGSYSYIDNELKAGKNFYKLKITYPNHTTAYSLVKVIRYLPKEDVISLFPNPTEKWIYFAFEGKENQEVQIWISSIVGQTSQKRLVVYPEEGKNIVKLNLSDLAQGAYLFHYQNSNGKTAVLKFVKSN